MKQKIRAFISITSLFMTSLLLVIVIFGWYVIYNNATVTGGSGSTASSGGDIIIKKTADGDDISYDGNATASSKIDVSLNNGTKIYPGCSGSFEFYIEYNSTSFTDIYSAILTFEVKASEIIDSTAKDEALKYINSHLVFFRSYDALKNIFSDWISPAGATYNITEDDDNHSKNITVYWIWIEEYSQLFDVNNKTIISDSDKSTIRSYYSDKLDKMFYESEQSNSGFNTADYVIGTALKKIYVELSARKGA